MFKLIGMVHWVAAFWNYLNFIENSYFNENTTWVQDKGLEDSTWISKI